MLILATAIAVSVPAIQTSGVGEVNSVRIYEAAVAAGEQQDQRKDCDTHTKDTSDLGEDFRISFAMCGPAASQASLLANPETPPTAFTSPESTIHSANAHMLTSVQGGEG